MAKAIGVKHLYKKYAKSTSYAVEDVSFHIEEGEILTLLGPSGCGKTTILRMLAGLEVPTSGEIQMNSHTVYDNTTWVAPECRRIGMVFQDYALFPHLTVKKNILFGLHWKTKEEREIIYDQVVDLVDLKGLDNRYPHQISGGQQQRVALARAIAPDPMVILFDEPFSNLDTALKAQVRLELLNILKKTNKSAIFVSHDIQDALMLSDKIAVMNNGKIEQIGTPKEVFDKPHTVFTANFMGHVNILKGIVVEPSTIHTGIGPLHINNSSEKGREIYCTVRPHYVKVDKSGLYKGKVLDRTYCGIYMELKIEVLGEDGEKIIITIHESPNLHIDKGQDISFHIEEKGITIIQES